MGLLRDPRSGIGVRLGFQIGTWLIVAFLVAGASGYGLWWLFGSPQLTGPLDGRERFDIVKIALAVTGGIGGVVALVVAHRKQRLSEADTIREDTRLFNERFDRAADKLGSDKAAIRLADIHAMAGLADDWPAGRQTCIDVLCAYLRIPDQQPAQFGREDWHDKRDADDEAAYQDAVQEQQVRHTVIRVIADRLWEDAPTSWQGCGFDFTGVFFDGGSFANCVFNRGFFDFTEAVFCGPVSFEGAHFTRAVVRFERAEFQDRANVSFKGARFFGGWVFFNAARFLGGRVGFEHADFKGSRVYFTDANFHGGTIDFGNATFQPGTGHGRLLWRLGVNGGLPDLIGVSFYKARFVGSKIDFSTSCFEGGTVDLSHPTTYAKPPKFPDGGKEPIGLLLPGNSSPG